MTYDGVRRPMSGVICGCVRSNRLSRCVFGFGASRPATDCVPATCSRPTQSGTVETTPLGLTLASPERIDACSRRPTLDSQLSETYG